MDKRTAIVWGATGQIASYLIELLLERDFKVYGVKRRSSTNTEWRIRHLLNNPDLEILEGDITDPSSVNHFTGVIKPDWQINTAAQSHVATSFEQPAYTFNVNANGVLYILESIKNLSPKTRFLQFSTSEMMGDSYTIDAVGEKYQDENTRFNPISQYAISKLAAYYLVRLYRQAYDIFSCNNINFNSESNRRGEEFVTRKITRWIAKYLEWKKSVTKKFIEDIDVGEDLLFESKGEYITATKIKSVVDQQKIGEFPKLRLGNLDAYRDWSHARDVCEGVYLALNYHKPDDYVFGSGITHTVGEFCKEAFEYAGINNWRDHIYIDPLFYRPIEVDYLKSNPSKAKEVLGWRITITFEQLVREMVDADIKREINGTL
jgi:GDPmannose 4,6-dehydratase